MATNEQLVIDALKPFKSDDLTTSALRVLAFTAVTDATNALRKGDFEAAARAAYALLHTLEALTQRGTKNGG